MAARDSAVTSESTPPGPRRRRPGGGRKPTIRATEQWAMRVNPEWLARVKVKAKDWNVSTSDLIRVLVDRGLEGDIDVLYPPERDDRELMIWERNRGRKYPK